MKGEGFCANSISKKQNVDSRILIALRLQNQHDPEPRLYTQLNFLKFY